MHRVLRRRFAALMGGAAACGRRGEGEMRGECQLLIMEWTTKIMSSILIQLGLLTTVDRRMSEPN
jgi:hypothetical protein